MTLHHGAANGHVPGFNFPEFLVYVLPESAEEPLYLLLSNDWFDYW